MRSTSLFSFLLLCALQASASDWNLQFRSSLNSDPLTPLLNDTVYATEGDRVNFELTLTGPGPGPPVNCFPIVDEQGVEHMGSGNMYTGHYQLYEEGIYRVMLTCPTPALQFTFTILFGSPTGVEEPGWGTGAYLFPTVFTHELGLSSAPGEVIELALMDMAGHAVFASRPTGGDTRRYDLSALPAGAYIARLRSTSGMRVQKVMKAE